MTTYLRARAEADPMSDYGHAMFVETTPAQFDADYDHLSSTYGQYVFSVAADNDTLTVPDFEAELRAKLSGESVLAEFKDAFGIDVTVDDIVGAFQPDYIVDSADAWDNGNLVELVWSLVIDPLGKDSVKTPDGMVHFNGQKITPVSI